MNCYVVMIPKIGYIRVLNKQMGILTHVTNPGEATMFDNWFDAIDVLDKVKQVSFTAKIEMFTVPDWH